MFFRTTNTDDAILNQAVGDILSETSEALKGGEVEKEEPQD